MKNLFSLLVLTIIIESGQAQDTLKLSLQEALHSAIKNNKEIALAKLSEDGAVAQFSQTNAMFLPQVNLSYTAVTTNNPLNAFGFKLQQQSVSATDFNPQLLNSPSATQNYTTKIEWNQPLINMDMVYQRKAARNQISLSHYRAERTKEYIAFEIEKAYAQLQLSHQSVGVLKEALHTTNSIFKASKNYFEKGLLQKSDLLRVQVQVTSIESKLTEAKNGVRNVSDYISLLTGNKIGPIYAADSLVKNVPNENLKTLLPENRADFKVLQSALKAQEDMVNSGRMSRVPKLNAFANYQLNDKAMAGFGSNSYLVGAQLSWSLFNGTASHYRIAEQKITRTKLEQQLIYQKEQGQLELNKAHRQLEEAQYTLRQYETSAIQAAEALRILQNRFEQGLATTNDLLQAQSTHAEQKLQLSEALFKHNSTLAYIHFLTSVSDNK